MNRQNGGQSRGREIKSWIFNGYKKGTKKKKSEFGYSRSPRRAWQCPVSCVAMVVTLGVVPARLCLTLPRTTPRLPVLILISPFKFLWYEQHAGQLSIGQKEYEIVKRFGIDKHSSLICPTSNKKISASMLWTIISSIHKFESLIY